MIYLYKGNKLDVNNLSDFLLDMEQEDQFHMIKMMMIMIKYIYYITQKLIL